LTEQAYANAPGHQADLTVAPAQATPPKVPSSGSDAPVPSGTAGAPLLSELDQLVSAKRLLEILWDEQSRPSIQWVRKETRRKMLPHIRRGRLIFYRPRSVMDWYSQRECRPNSMK
jgi:hypothetical protein